MRCVFINGWENVTLTTTLTLLRTTVKAWLHNSISSPPPLPTEENYSQPQGSRVLIVSNLIDSDSFQFDVNESGRSIVAGIFAGFEK